MAKLENSKRRIPQSTYVRVDVPNGGSRFVPTKPWLKRAVIAAAAVSGDEAKKLFKKLRNRADDLEAAAQLEALKVLEQHDFAKGDSVSDVGLKEIAALDLDVLLKLGDALIAERSNSIERAIVDHEELISAFYKSQRSETEAVMSVPDGFQESESDPQRFEQLGGARIFERRTTGNRNERGSDAEAGAALVPSERIEGRLVWDSVEQLPVARRIEPSMSDLLVWASGDDGLKKKAARLVSLANRFSYNPDKLVGKGFSDAMRDQLRHSKAVLAGFRKQKEVEPIGMLHLERLTFAPDGIELGELVHSVPLAPGEEVSISHKEWATSSEEFERIVTDSLEEFSEEGVTESTELSQSSRSQQRHSNSLSASITATGGYGPVSVTSGVSTSIQDSSDSTREFTKNQSISVTRKASSKAKSEHKITFKVESSSGSENTTVQKIKNPFLDKASRVDYYQLIRKWEVNVYRYDVRLTYDIVIPEPGSDVLSRIEEINNLSLALQQGFGSDDSTLEWARFDLVPSEISRTNYPSLAAKYNASVPPPPKQHKYYDESLRHNWFNEDDAKPRRYLSIAIDVDEDYLVDEVAIDKEASAWNDTAWEFQIQGKQDFYGTSGRRELIVQTKYLGAVYVELRVRAKLHPDVFREWQLSAWSAMREAAQSRYYEQRVSLQNRVAELRDSLGDSDALSLRMFERDEIMKGVLRWLFGPDFRFIPDGLPSEFYDGGEAIKSQKIWKEINRHGELIKFLHHAIEWENVLYFLYPYFWSDISRWETKKYLRHPDPRHTAFLKSGSARVVLTIRPGFEADFLSLVEGGAIGSLPSDHPYLSIVEEMRNFANTNYPGIPPANGEENYDPDEGQKIGTWHEYTPTSALDIRFDEDLPAA